MAVLLMVPLLPVTVMVVVPLLALLLTVTVRVDWPPLMELNEYCRPVLLGLAGSITVPVKLFTGAMVTV